MGFAKDFVWGAATSAYQVEGAAMEDGKGMHIWDVYTKEPGHIFDGHTGDTACDHYHRFRDDVADMKKMGLQAYRFSIDWSRVLPEGRGRINEAGVEFYNNLIDALLEAGIEPYITLYHWELPYELYKRGGWLNPEMAGWFGDYAKLAAERFSDRVKYFFTLNEPQCFIGHGFLLGEHAPGVQAPLRDTFEMSHNVLKAHGQAVQMLRQYGKQPLIIGYAPTGSMCYPETEKQEDIEAARQMLFSMPDDDRNWAWNVAWWSDPVLLGQYPEEGIKRYEAYLPEITDEDMKLISEPIDIYGQNIYNGRCIRMGAEGKPEEVIRYDGFPRTAIGWPVTPECMYWGPKFLYERYRKPIYITENGLSCHDVISLDGKVHDPNRIDFLSRYLTELKKAAGEMELGGYFQWSLMDNFEWTKGYSERFGLIFVNYQTQDRIWKDSAYWYQNLIHTNGKELKKSPGGWNSMKRSRINQVIKDMEALIKKHGFEIPPFASWTVNEWENAGQEYDEIRDNCLGWDITDYGLDNFDKVGFALLTIRNGNQKMPEKYPKTYAEKLLMLYEGQTAPMHYHWNKMEDIINRGGNRIYITVYNGAEDGGMLDTDVTVHLDGKTDIVPAGTKVCLKPGESITITPYMYHDFVVPETGGAVLLGEVSMCNDDENDNRFYEPIGRFPEIEEDEVPYRMLCNEYPKAK